MATSFDPSQISDQIVAVGALGTAAFGLVDTSKAFRGGVSNSGFGFIRAALTPFDLALTQALGDDPLCDWRAVMRSHWISGRPRDEQKAIAVGLIQLGLTEATARVIAPAGQVDPEGLAGVVRALINGAQLDSTQLNVLGRFKATIEARIDAAYDRADQVYRNWARLAAGLVAVALALLAAYLLDYRSSREFGVAFLIGLVSVPLAPVAKDVAKALTTAVSALGDRLAK